MTTALTRTEELPDEAILARIDEVAPAEAGVLRGHLHRFSVCATPFYRRTRILEGRAERWDTPVIYRYAEELTSDLRAGTIGKLLPINGTPERLGLINRKEGLKLAQDELPAYVRFFFENVGDSMLRIIESVEELPWADGVADDETWSDLYSQCRELVRPILAEGAGRDCWTVYACGHWDRHLVQVKLTVTAAGEVTPVEPRVLVEGLPFSALKGMT